MVYNYPKSETTTTGEHLPMKKDNDKTARDPVRRTTLKTLLTGGGALTLSALPAQWVRPVVDAVVLPTHAQTSPQVAANGFAISFDEVRAPSWWERIIPSAHARILPSGFLCIEEREGEGKDYKASYDVGPGVFRTSGDYGKCTNLDCGGRGGFSLLVTGRNDDGSFDFELYFGSGCDGEPIEVNTTDTPCKLKPEECEVVKEDDFTDDITE